MTTSRVYWQVRPVAEYREELKYMVPQHELDIIHARLSVLMPMDENQEGESYRIRSLYFDDYMDSALYENDAGTDNRYKIRIRVYEDPLQTMNLEIKYKHRGKTRKEACPLTPEQFHDITNGRLPFDPDYPKPLMLTYLKMQMNLLKPKIIVEYERTAFTYFAGNVRITFDRNVSYSERIEDFFEDRLDLVPLLRKNMHILEVKYDEFLPDPIAQLLETGTMAKTAFSKYYLSRLSAQGETLYADKLD